MAPAGSTLTWPLGVKTKTSSSNRSTRSDSRKSSLDELSAASMTLSNQGSEPLPSARLYSQWAATPNSAVWCMDPVRTWISSGFPWGPITVVWSDW